jgi:hypothetical protein
LAANAAAAGPAFDLALTYPESLQVDETQVDADASFQLVTLCDDGANEPACGASECSEGLCDGAACGNDACCDDDRCGSTIAGALRCPTWTVRAGAAYLHRSRPAPLVLVRPIAGPGAIAGGEDFAMGWSAGPDVSFRRRTSRGNEWELRYFGALQWDSPVVQYGAVGNVQIGSFSNFGATNLTGQYLSSLHSTELNWRRPHSERLSWLAGFRWIELSEDINSTITFPAFSALYNWHTTNHLYGGQLGADLNLWRLSGPLSINSVFKGGVYGNDANNDFTLLPSTGGVFNGGLGGMDVAFVGEIGVTSAYQLSRHCALRGGYQLLWIDGAALASDQMAASTARATQTLIDSTGAVFYHGALMSLDVSW